MCWSKCVLLCSIISKKIFCSCWWLRLNIDQMLKRLPCSASRQCGFLTTKNYGHVQTSRSIVNVSEFCRTWICSKLKAGGGQGETLLVLASGQRAKRWFLASQNTSTPRCQCAKTFKSQIDHQCRSPKLFWRLCWESNFIVLNWLPSWTLGAWFACISGFYGQVSSAGLNMFCTTKNQCCLRNIK